MPEVMFSGPEGKIEGRYTAGRDSNSPIALILHPHPLDGGTMNNKMVYNLFHIFVSRGFSVLRFNFRGVGKSEGQFGKVEGELADATMAIDWLQKQNNTGRKCWVAGFSFGSFVAMQLLMRRPEFFRFIVVAPLPNIYDFNFLSPCPTSGLVLQGGCDQFISKEIQQKFVDRLMAQKNINISFHIIEGADHFFNKYMADVQKIVGEYIDEQLLIDDEPMVIPDHDEEEDMNYYNNLNSIIGEDDDD